MDPEATVPAATAKATAARAFRLSIPPSIAAIATRSARARLRSAVYRARTNASQLAKRPSKRAARFASTNSATRTTAGCAAKICPSAICQAGKCVGKGFGHEIVIGMDYADPLIVQTSAQVQMLANSVLLVNQATINVLAYDEFSDAANTTKIETWLSAIAKPRTINFVSSKDWMSIPSKLAVTDYQVFLVFDQPMAPADQMATSGTLWNGAIDSFAKGGGVVVVLEGGTGHNVDLLTNGGILPVTGETNVAGTQVMVDAPTDVVGLYLPNVFAARKNSVSFTTTQVADSRHVFVVKDSAGVLPVVVHSVP